MTYIISTQMTTKRASSKAEALKIARQMSGATRLYRGSEYQHDASAREAGTETESGRVYGMATDYWEERANAGRETNSPADVVVLAVA